MTVTSIDWFYECGVCVCRCCCCCCCEVLMERKIWSTKPSLFIFNKKSNLWLREMITKQLACHNKSDDRVTKIWRNTQFVFLFHFHRKMCKAYVFLFNVPNWNYSCFFFLNATDCYNFSIILFKYTTTHILIFNKRTNIFEQK